MTTLVVNLIAIVLTIMVLSRIVGDNPLFRAAQYIFVGVSLGIAFVVAYHEVLSPAVEDLVAGDASASLLYAPPLVLGLLLLPRITRRQGWSWLANIPLALVFGVGSALAVGGAVAGTLIPQIADSARIRGGGIDQLIGTIVLALGTVVTLSAFYYTVPREGRSGGLVRGAAAIGHWLLMIAFGFFFASAVQTYISALTERLSFMLNVVVNLAGF